MLLEIGIGEKTKFRNVAHDIVSPEVSDLTFVCL